MLFVFLSFIAGICAIIKPLIAFLICIMVFLYLIYKKEYYKILLFIMFGIIIFVLTQSRIYKYDNKYEDGSFSGVVRIINEYGETDKYNKFLCKNNSGDRWILFIRKDSSLKVGIQDEVFIDGKIIMPDVNRNSKSFNYRRYLNSQNIFGSIIVKKCYIKNVNKMDFISNTRFFIKNLFSKILPSDYSSLVTAMICGDKKLLSDEITEDFRNSGVSHMLAVSGAHLSCLVLFSGFALNKVFGKKLSYYLSIIIIVLFIFISGASSSVSRAGIMAIINILAILLSRKSNALNNLFLSGNILLFINPCIIFDVGFILSFVGTLGILLFSPKITLFLNKYSRFQTINSILAVSVSSQLVLLPIMIYYFHSISTVSILTNLLITTVFGLIMILGFSAFFIGLINVQLSKVFSFSLYFLIKYIFKVTSFLADLPFSNIVVPTPNSSIIIGYYLILFAIFSDSIQKSFFIFKKYISLKRIIQYILAVIILFNLILCILPSFEVKLHMIDVGQGDCFLIESRHGKLILIDTGGSETSSYDVGENVLVPYLLANGKYTIDLMIISHPHMDHIGGAFTTIEKLHVKEVMIGKNLENEELVKKLRQVCNTRKTTITAIDRGDSFVIDDISFEILHPDKNYLSSNLNNMSLIIEMECEGVKSLFTGDFEDTNENIDRIIPNVDILKVAHHGSDTSNSESLLKKSSPKVALISVGKNNSFGHPKKSVIERLSNMKVKIYRTDLMGEVVLKIRNKRIKVYEHGV